MSSEKLEFEVVADGFLFPEGPISLSDGSVLLVDMLGGQLRRAYPNGSVGVVAELGGGPNGAAIGPDGLAYVVNNGGMAWWRGEDGSVVTAGAASSDHRGGWIDRVDIDTGAVERLLDSAGGHRLSAPNDIVFDSTGGFWFTDMGMTVGRIRHMSGIYYVPAGSNVANEVVFGGTSFNGIGLSPDERTLYVADTREATLWAYGVSSPGVLDPTIRRPVFRHPGPVGFDSLALQADGSICVGVIFDGAIAIVSPAGTFEQITLPDKLVTNICFGGPDGDEAYITFSETGRLVKLKWPEPGLRLKYNR